MHGKTQEDRSCACSSSAALMQPWFTGFHLCPKHDLQDFTSVQSMICRISPPSEPLAHTSCNASLAWLWSGPSYISVVQTRVLFIQTFIHKVGLSIYYTTMDKGILEPCVGILLAKTSFLRSMTTLHICHNHHNRWLCKKIQSSVKFSNGYVKETDLILHKMCSFTKSEWFTQILKCVIWYTMCNFRHCV